MIVSTSFRTDLKMMMQCVNFLLVAERWHVALCRGAGGAAGRAAPGEVQQGEAFDYAQPTWFKCPASIELGWRPVRAPKV